MRNIKCERYKGNLEIKNARKEENCLGKPWCEERMKRFLIRFDAKKFNMTSLAPYYKGFEDYVRKLWLNQGFLSEL